MTGPVPDLAPYDRPVDIIAAGAATGRRPLRAGPHDHPPLRPLHAFGVVPGQP